MVLVSPISPEWNGIVTSDKTAADYSDKKAIKAIVLMTDGGFNTVGDRNFSTNGVRSSNLAVVACSTMRAKGIRFYTVGFKLDEARAVQTLKDCAADPRNFFETSSGDELRDAFKAIAQQIDSLRPDKLITSLQRH